MREQAPAPIQELPGDPEATVEYFAVGDGSTNGHAEADPAMAGAETQAPVEHVPARYRDVVADQYSQGLLWRVGLARDELARLARDESLSDAQRVKEERRVRGEQARIAYEQAGGTQSKVPRPFSSEFRRLASMGTEDFRALEAEAAQRAVAARGQAVGARVLKRLETEAAKPTIQSFKPSAAARRVEQPAPAPVKEAEAVKPVHTPKVVIAVPESEEDRVRYTRPSHLTTAVTMEQLEANPDYYAQRGDTYVDRGGFAMSTRDLVEMKNLRSNRRSSDAPEQPAAGPDAPAQGRPEAPAKQLDAETERFIEDALKPENLLGLKEAYDTAVRKAGNTLHGELSQRQREAIRNDLISRYLQTDVRGVIDEGLRGLVSYSMGLSYEALEARIKKAPEKAPEPAVDTAAEAARRAQAEREAAAAQAVADAEAAERAQAAAEAARAAMLEHASTGRRPRAPRTRKALGHVGRVAGKVAGHGKKLASRLGNAMRVKDLPGIDEKMAHARRLGEDERQYIEDLQRTAAPRYEDALPITVSAADRERFATQLMLLDATRAEYAATLDRAAQHKPFLRTRRRHERLTGDALASIEERYARPREEVFRRILIEQERGGASPDSLAWWNAELHRVENAKLRLLRSDPADIGGAWVPRGGRGRAPRGPGILRRAGAGVRGAVATELRRPRTTHTIASPTPYRGFQEQPQRQTEPVRSGRLSHRIGQVRRVGARVRGAVAAELRRPRVTHTIRPNDYRNQ